MNRIKSVTLEGFRSFSPDSLEGGPPLLPGRGRTTNQLRFEDVTVLIGPNGAGKSTVTSFFDMIGFLSTGALQDYIGRHGGGDSLLHYGARRTPVLRTALEFEDTVAGRTTAYEMVLAHAANDTLIFTNESTKYQSLGYAEPMRIELGAGHRESLLRASADHGDRTSQIIQRLLSHCCAYHFHDTSDAAKIRKSGYIEDNRYLRSDAGNLAAFLYGMKNAEGTRSYFERIEKTVQLAFPQLKGFVLEPQQLNGNYIMLNWYSRHDSNYLLGPHQISDGALRFMALTTLLSQPPETLSGLVVLDEPEIGLHPHAIGLLAEMLKSAAESAQVLVATQSPVLVDHFDLSRIRPIEQRKGRSVILELDSDAYGEWIDEYSTGELWEKNLLGGGAVHG